MKVGIVVLNYNGKEDTLSCLSSIKKLKKNGHEIEIVIVDNGSSDNSVSEIRKTYPQVHLLVNSENLGFSDGNNIGIRYALKLGVDYIFILNNDTTVDEHCIEELINATDIEKTDGIFGPKIYFSPGHEYHRTRYKASQLGKVLWYGGGKVDWDNILASHRGVDEVDEGQYDELSKTQFISGCAMFVRSEVFNKIGLFDTKLHLYYEDLDLCKRAQAKGFEIYYVPKAIVWHSNAATAGGSGSKLQSYYITRNRLLIGMRYATWRAKLALFREAAIMILKGTKEQKQAVGDFLRKKYGKRYKS